MTIGSGREAAPVSVTKGDKIMQVFLFIAGGVLTAAGVVWVTVYCFKLPKLLMRYADEHPTPENGDKPVSDGAMPFIKDTLIGVFKKTWYHVVIPFILLIGGLYALSAAMDMIQ